VKRLLLLLLLPAGLLLSSCVPSTPQTRIQQHPDLFAALSPKHQQLVQQGALAKGMPRDAVMLAWGPPAQRFEGSQGGKSSERWDYSGAYPVYTHGFYGGFGYGRYGCYPYGYGFMPEVTYVPYRRASVWFIDSLVDSWERTQ
jgi:hypothetical protein